MCVCVYVWVCNLFQCISQIRKSMSESESASIKKKLITLARISNIPLVYKMPPIYCIPHVDRVINTCRCCFFSFSLLPPLNKLCNLNEVFIYVSHPLNHICTHRYNFFFAATQPILVWLIVNSLIPLSLTPFSLVGSFGFGFGTMGQICCSNWQ